MLKMINPVLLKVLAGCIILLGLNTVIVSTTFAETVDEDMVLANGNILTMNPEQPTASAMAVEVNRGRLSRLETWPR